MYDMHVAAVMMMECADGCKHVLSRKFGPFTKECDAEECVKRLAGRANVISAMINDKRFLPPSMDGIRCLGNDCHGLLQESALGWLRCPNCDKEYRILTKEETLGTIRYQKDAP